ncbi:hypothetical protein [Bacillus sinesaloumensis]|uniref:hypothetical protein n=1 Tax=Litchfieldia sinesaloumensis TaxID=1926280 RepID=UPI00098874F0|nr:hypothetical protein [Bacillus sinesaloumensis]
MKKFLLAFISIFIIYILLDYINQKNVETTLAEVQLNLETDKSTSDGILIEGKIDGSLPKFANNQLALVIPFAQEARVIEILSPNPNIEFVSRDGEFHYLNINNLNNYPFEFSIQIRAEELEKIKQIDGFIQSKPMGIIPHEYLLSDNNGS